ncbi:hypothetical protein ATY76_22425 [Rhizobium sp. R339]|uniref:serine hydrolase domain-containing protein n=1 Tax=Rhizobium sp. R339 TaxID=1764273 RepID=UPI000B52EC03|nr:serine hydrolase domain-containing protein [Rhizobium sp. R339]OWV64204.1 hypothetical protein ATY76_22425 [Rhizobium sp. R339]
MEARVFGHHDPSFQRVAAVLQAHLSSGRDMGAGVCVYHKGRCVVDIWGGQARSGKAWHRETIVPLTSLTKPLLAFAVVRLAEQGVIDLEAPVATYWPKFAAAGKSDVLVSHILSHSAGLPVFDYPVTLADQIERKALADRLAGMTPLWRPGALHGYHAITFGFLVGEILERVTGSDLVKAFRMLLSQPSQAKVSIAVECDETETVAQTYTQMSSALPIGDVPPHLREYVEGMTNEGSLLYRATFGSTSMTFEDMNDPRYLIAPRPAAYGTATGVAKIWSAVIGHGPQPSLISEPWLQKIRKERIDGIDQVFRVRSRWGLGVMLRGGPLIPTLPKGAFGHLGSTGALSFGDPENGLAFAYLPNLMKSVYELPDRRAAELTNAVYSCLETGGDQVDHKP